MCRYQHIYFRINLNILRPIDYALVGALFPFTSPSIAKYVVLHLPGDINKNEASTQKRKQFRVCAVKGRQSEWRGC
jgi:hypothetical protein